MLPNAQDVLGFVARNAIDPHIPASDRFGYVAALIAAIVDQPHVTSEQIQHDAMTVRIALSRLVSDARALERAA